MNTFHQLASARPAKQTFLDAQTSLSYGDLSSQIARTVTLLRERGLEAGDRVVLATEDGAAFAVLLMAMVDMRVAVILGDPGMTASEFERFRVLLSPKGCIVDQRLLDDLSVDRSQFQVCVPIKPGAAAGGGGGGLLGKLFGKKRPAPSKATTFPAVLDGVAPTVPEGGPDDDVAFIVMTSGSTSQSKAVPGTRKSLMTHLGTLVTHFGYDDQSRIMNLLPLSHVDGVMQGPLLACRAGATWVRPFPFSVQNIEPMMHGIYSKRVTHFIGVPTILSLVLRMAANLEESFDTDDFRFVVSSAGKLDAELWASFERTFKTRVCNFFGMSETVTGGIFSGPGDDTYRQGTIGKPIDCEARLVDPDSGQPVDDGATGELQLRGDNIFGGYLAADPSVNEGLFVDGWLRTGDLAHRDPDGFYVIDGRIKNVVISGGENIYAEEITEVLSEHPKVTDAVCFGRPHDQWGEILVALVQRSDEALTENDLIAWARERLSAYKVPKEVAFAPELPRGRSGKIRMLAAKELFDGARGADEAALGDVNERVTALAASTFKTPADGLTPASGPHNTPGWDSLAHITFVVALESAFSIKMATAEIMALQSLEAAVRIITEHRGRA